MPMLFQRTNQAFFHHLFLARCIKDDVERNARRSEVPIFKLERVCWMRVVSARVEASRKKAQELLVSLSVKKRKKDERKQDDVSELDANLIFFEMSTFLSTNRHDHCSELANSDLMLWSGASHLNSPIDRAGKWFTTTRRSCRFGFTGCLTSWVAEKKLREVLDSSGGVQLELERNEKTEVWTSRISRHWFREWSSAVKWKSDRFSSVIIHLTPERNSLRGALRAPSYYILKLVWLCLFVFFTEPDDLFLNERTAGSQDFRGMRGKKQIEKMKKNCCPM